MSLVIEAIQKLSVGIDEVDCNVRKKLFKSNI